MPFRAPMLSCLHLANIVNLERDACPYPGRETISHMALAKGLTAGPCRMSAKSKKRRRLQIRRFQDLGGAFRPLSDFSAEERADVYRRLYRKRWGAGSFLLGEAHLATVFGELAELMFGDMLFFADRPVAMELVYKTQTPHCLIANGVQAGYDPQFLDHSVGSILFYHNLERLEDEAILGARELRYSLGWSDSAYKAQWAFEERAYRLGATTPSKGAPHPCDERDATSGSALRRLSRPVRRIASSVSTVLRLRAQRAATALSSITAAGAPRDRDPTPREPALAQDLGAPDRLHEAAVAARADPASSCEGGHE
jgi:hypothetical protein